MMTADPPPQSSSSDHMDVLLALMAELGAMSRYRSEAEHLYTAASVGGFGAVAWGVAALDPDKYGGRCWWNHPATLAAIGVTFVAVMVTLKIAREHIVYVDIKQKQARVGSLIAGITDNAGTTGANADTTGKIIRDEWRKKELSCFLAKLSPILLRLGGHALSIFIVIMAAVGAIAFCLLTIL